MPATFDFLRHGSGWADDPPTTAPQLDTPINSNAAGTWYVTLRKLRVTQT